MRGFKKRINNIKSGAAFTLIELLVVIAIIGLLSSIVSSIVLVALNSARNKAKYAKAKQEIQIFIKAAVIAQGETKKTLMQITGSGCSECVCRGRNIQGISDSDQCVVNWYNVLTKIQTATGGLVQNLTQMKRDAWNAPYGLDENEGEGGPSDCRYDSIISAGPDGVLWTSDDYRADVPHIICP